MTIILLSLALMGSAPPCTAVTLTSNPVTPTSNPAQYECPWLEIDYSYSAPEMCRLTLSGWPRGNHPTWNQIIEVPCGTLKVRYEINGDDESYELLLREKPVGGVWPPGLDWYKYEKRNVPR